MALLFGICLLCSTCFAAVDRDAKVAVMDFGTRPGATPAEISINNAEHTSSEYLITRLINNNCFDVVDKDMAFNKIQAENLNTIGLIDPDTAKRIADLLGVKYLLYGNITNVSVSDTGTQIAGNIGGGVNICTVKAHIIARLMDADTGAIVMAAKGDGKSKSSFVKVASGGALSKVVVVKVGTAKVTQDSVHNAIQKAAFATVDDLVQRLFAVKTAK